VEGQNIVLVFPSAEVRPERLADIAAKLVRLKVDVIVTAAEVETAARALGVQLQILEVGGAVDFEGAFQAASRGRADALPMLDDPLTFSHRTRIVSLAAKNRVPAMYGFRELAEAGGLMSYSVSLTES
jgi:ABC-type uncharacterized transport system substrate-binding protein